MNNNIFEKYRGAIRNLSENAFEEKNKLDESLLLERDGAVSIYYAPFEYVNLGARIVIVGITPGKVQALNALKEAKAQIAAGADASTVIQAAKQVGAFSGPMRINLVNLLDCIGVQRWLGVQSNAELFGTASRLMQTASVLQYPVLAGGENYNGTPDMLKHPLLKRHLLEYFGRQARMLPDSLFVPLGDKVAQALRFVAGEGAIKPTRILEGLPHPSGANAERIAYFLGEKPKEMLSKKTDFRKIDAAKAELMRKMSMLIDRGSIC